MKPDFSIRDSLRVGWEKTRAHSALLFGIVIIIALLSMAHGILSAHPLASVSQAVASGFLLLFEIIVSIGATIVVLRLGKNESVSFRMIIPPWSSAWRYLLSSVLVVLILCAGLVVPVGLGIWAYTFSGLSLTGKILIALCGALAVAIATYLILVYSMVKFISVDGKPKLFDILRRSVHITHGVRWKLLLFFIILLLLNIVGVIVFLVGLLVTLPVTMIASAQIYLTLSERAQPSEKLNA